MRSTSRRKAGLPIDRRFFFPVWKKITKWTSCERRPWPSVAAQVIIGAITSAGFFRDGGRPAHARRPSSHWGAKLSVASQVVEFLPHAARRDRTTTTPLSRRGLVALGAEHARHARCCAPFAATVLDKDPRTTTSMTSTPSPRRPRWRHARLRVWHGAPRNRRPSRRPARRRRDSIGDPSARGQAHGHQSSDALSNALFSPYFVLGEAFRCRFDDVQAQRHVQRDRRRLEERLRSLPLRLRAHALDSCCASSARDCSSDMFDHMHSAVTVGCAVSSDRPIDGTYVPMPVDRIGLARADGDLALRARVLLLRAGDARAFSSAPRPRRSDPRGRRSSSACACAASCAGSAGTAAPADTAPPR